MKVLSAAQMREVDRLTTERCLVPGLLLMESAAARTVEAVEERFGSLHGKRALIICGRGNNGGDGAAIARQLHTKGASVDLLLLARIDDARGDARKNFEIARALSVTAPANFRVIEIDSAEHLSREVESRPHELVFDAIFGTGLTRAASGIFEEAIGLINLLRDRRGSRVTAVDIPSGIASDESELIGPAVRADLTVTFTAPKIGNVLPPASDCGGELVVAPIGTPAELIEEAGSRINLVERDAIERWLTGSRRSPHANKGDAGKVLVVAGSRGKTGAASLAGEAAMRAGAGLVTVASPASAQPVLASILISECMTEPLEETTSGAAAREAVERALELAAERDVLAIGPGLGSYEESTRAFVRAIAMQRQRPLVIDADGLNALAPWAENLRGSEELPIILTPHPGEMSRLVGRPIADVVARRAEVASEFATLHGVIVVLKGSRTVIAAPDGEVYINPTGNAGMATGGTGDVLTGVVAGLLAQKPDDALGATITAVFLHGYAGDIAASRIGTRAMIASDISSHLGEAFMAVGKDAERFIKL
jgi:NAD(P)H-hydrate epimerase